MPIARLLPCAFAGFAVAALSGCAEPAYLQTYVPPRAEIVSLAGWDYEGLRGGWRAEQALDMPVFGPGGERIGEIDNLIVGPDGGVRSAVIEVGEGFLGIGGTRLSVPWPNVDFVPGGARVPLSERDVRAYGLFEDVQVTEGPRSWKAAELLEDYVRLADGSGYGWVEDLVFDSHGRLQAVVVARDISHGPGLCAFPYYGYPYGFDPGLGYYRLPYGPLEIVGVEPFDYGVI